MEESVDRITSKILEDATTKSQEIKDQSENEANEKLEAAKRKGESTKEKLVLDAQKTADQIRKKIIAESTIKARTILLESKEKLIGEAFEKAKEKLEKLPQDKNYSKILTELTIDTCTHMGGGELEIIVRKEDEKFISKSLNNIESDVKKITGEKTTIRTSASKISPGLIVRRGDGKVQIDSTFQTRLELLRSELRLRVAEELFQ
jgi:vacuolar-type H+-ATPase subunit E/Vma4